MYVGRELLTEYTFGTQPDLALNTQMTENHPLGLFAESEVLARNGTTQLIPFPLYLNPQSILINPPITYVSFVGNFSYPTIDVLIPSQIDLTIRWSDEVNSTNSTLAIESFDGVFRRFPEAFAWALPQLLPQIAKEDNITLTAATNVTDVLTNHASLQICKIHQEYCTGDLQQYAE